MSIFTGTYTKYTTQGIREDLSDVISRISPEDTPLLSGMKRGPKPGNTLFEWQTDSLAAAVTTNAQLEGDDITSVETCSPTVRVGNYCQISRKTLAITGTNEELNKAGRKSEMSLNIAKKGAELKLDQEATLFAAQAGNAGSTTTARTTAALNAWVKTNTAKGVGGGDPAYTSGVPGAVRTDGTQTTLTETIAKTVVQALWTNGGKQKLLYVGPVNKQRISSSFSGIATHTIDVTKAAPTMVVGAVDVWVNDFGMVRIVASRNQRDRDAWFIDPEYLKLRLLRPYRVEKLSKTGDADKRMMLVEWGLEVKNEAALGLVADCTTT